MLRGVKRGEPAICNRPCDKEDLSCEIEDEHAHIALGCRDILLSAYNDDYQAEKENRNKDGNRSIHDSLPNAGGHRTPDQGRSSDCCLRVKRSWEVQLNAGQGFGGLYG